jgi:uncharacterized membrane protein YjfL (UPF0719 family)
MNELAMAAGRKVMTLALVMLTYLVFDGVILRGFKTREKLKDDPKAIAMLLGAFSIAVALA